MHGQIDNVDVRPGPSDFVFDSLVSMITFHHMQRSRIP